MQQDASRHSGGDQFPWRRRNVFFLLVIFAVVILACNNTLLTNPASLTTDQSKLLTFDESTLAFTSNSTIAKVSSLESTPSTTTTKPQATTSFQAASQESKQASKLTKPNNTTTITTAAETNETSLSTRIAPPTTTTDNKRVPLTERSNNTSLTNNSSRAPTTLNAPSKPFTTTQDVSSSKNVTVITAPKRPTWFSSPATTCLRQEEARQNQMAWIDFENWLENLPILYSAHVHGQELHVTFMVVHLKTTLAHRFVHGHWYCGNNNHNKSNPYDDKDEANTSIINATSVVMGQADVNSVLRVVCLLSTTTSSSLPTNLLSVWPLDLEQPTDDDNNTTTTVNVTLYNNRRYDYDVQPLLDCHELQHDELPLPVKNQQLELGACLMLGGSSTAWNLRLDEWIAYHRILGIQHFWIYLHKSWDEYYYADGNKNNATIHPLPTALDITYIPYHVFFHDAHSQERLEYVRRRDAWQVAMNNACLLRAEEYGLKWIITTDADEMIWVQPPPNDVNEDSNYNLTAWIRNYPLLHFLNTRLRQSDKSKMNGLVMNNIPYGSLTQVPVRNKKRKMAATSAVATTDPTEELMMDYVYKYNVTIWERMKCLIKVNSVPMDVGTHAVWGAKRKLNANTEIHVRHFKKPHMGIHWPAGKRYRHSEKSIVKDSSLPDLYRELVLQEMENKRREFRQE